MSKKKTTQVPRTTIPEELREQLIAAVDAELKSEFPQRRKLNKESPSFPYHHRTMANRDSLGTGPKNAFMVGKHKVYRKASLLDMLRADLS